MTLPVHADIILRNYQEEDAAQLFAAVEENRAHLRPWLIWVDGTRKMAHSLEYIRNARQEQYNQQSIAFGIFRNDRLIGGLGMHQWDQRLRKAQIGYWLVASEVGNGTMTRCIAVLLDYLFGQLELNKVELHYLPANTRSAAVAERLGFGIEGILRDSFLMNGTLHDLVVAGLLKKEYKSV
ncbi:GNAT family N-acetyltransferase [Taibaiella koreensis]|uniref:GNAT family N-acetyltransferase n=1 Tax=Taibaiella koreensis TaxID=1268548 RepID=UPI000E5A0072|nr:GNAT family protein [Taibaiella koreensis]